MGVWMLFSISFINFYNTIKCYFKIIFCLIISKLMVDWFFSILKHLNYFLRAWWDSIKYNMNLQLLMLQEKNNNFISSNYLIVSGEHRVHFNTNICSKFCCTTHPFHAFESPSLLLYMGGSVFILVFRRECVPNTAVTLRLSVL